MRSSTMTRYLTLLLAVAGAVVPLDCAAATMGAFRARQPLPSPAIAAPSHGSRAKPGLSLALVPWTGPQAPGNVPETLKYRLAVVGNAGESVELRAVDVPKGWIATFCTEHVCTPNRTRITLPSSRMAVIEFALVPSDGSSAVPKVRVIGNGGEGAATATTPMHDAKSRRAGSVPGKPCGMHRKDAA